MPHDSRKPIVSPHKTATGKTRLDVLIVERGLAPSRERAQAMVLAGQVRVNGKPAAKAGAQIPADALIEPIGEPQKYASRGGLKLEGALDDFAIDLSGKICLDIGSSTGGFTDCMLQRGAAKVYAVDVTTSQLDWKLQSDPRVKMVKRNARYLSPEDIGEPADFVAMDVSFISITRVLPAIVPLVKPGGDLLLMVKPQFELTKQEVGKGGIVREPELRQKAVDRVVKAATSLSLTVEGTRPSRVKGAEGNQEFFLYAHGAT
jgi:23S rRNA (cytidine1920-2'-O)/16S rRNA (cytidine1409-2'-O)-methyltransferase